MEEISLSLLTWKIIQNSNILLNESIEENHIPKLDTYLLESVRPATYYGNKMEHVNDCYRYFIHGSGFIINFFDTSLFLTARHNIHKDSMHENYAEFENKARNVLITEAR